MNVSIRARLIAAFGFVIAIIVLTSLLTYRREEAIESSLSATSSRTLIATRSLGSARVFLERVRQRHFFHAALAKNLWPR